MKKQLLFVSAFAMSFAFTSCGSGEAKVEKEANAEVEQIVDDAKEEVADIKEEAAAQIEEVKTTAKKDIKKKVENTKEMTNKVDVKGGASKGTTISNSKLGDQLQKQAEVTKETQKAVEEAKKENAGSIERKPRQQ